MIFLPALSYAQIDPPGVNAGFRIRSANIDTGNNSADSITVKVRLDFDYAFGEEFSTFLQFDHVESFLKENHSSGVLYTDNPLISDTPGSEVNQLFLSYDNNVFKVKLGRQNITFDSQRFVGDIGFWQNDQTFDGVTFAASLFTRSSIEYGYVNNVNRIFGDQADDSLSSDDFFFDLFDGKRPVEMQGNHKLDGNFLHFSYKEWDYVELAAYGYAVHNYDVPLNSNRTIGVSSNYHYKPNNIKYFGSLELAWQKRQGTGVEQWIPYRLLEAGIGLKGLDLSFRWEHLGEKDGATLDTPLGSRHEFQGWADAFPLLPLGGFDDIFFRVNYRMRPWQVDMRYHRFRSQSLNIDFGDEFDLDLIFSPSREHEIRLRYAEFTPSSDDAFFNIQTKSLFFSYSYNL